MSQITQGMMSSDTDQWFTPATIVEQTRNLLGLDAFDLDIAADADNAKAPRYYTVEDNALQQEWNCTNGWLNPPYGRIIGQFTQRAIEQVENGNAERITLLVPARTDTNWFQELADWATHIHFIKGRIKFENPEKGNTQSAPFPSAIVHLDARELGAAHTTYGTL